MHEYKHSVKVPRNYKLAASILKKALTEGASVKSLVFEDKLKHFRTNVLYALISEAIKHNSEIDKLFESTEILKNESRLDPWLAKILTVELLFGKKCLPGQSKPELAVASYKELFESYSTEHPADIKKKGSRRPRYVRINTNLMTTSDAIRAFQDEGYRLVRCTSGPYADYLRQVAALEQYDFTQDYHVKTVFVFPPGTNLHEHQLYYENKIILQDKATALAVQLLAPPPGATVLDMCAAPGMKTTQLAAYLKNQGTVYAVEQNEDRYKTLCNFVEKTGSTCVKTIQRDTLNIRRGEYSDVEYILLDPSCSGSGMDLCAHNYMEEARLSRLTSLQEKFLKHALNAFPRAKRIVYSTCSLLPQENERVVTNVVTQCRTRWNVIDVKELLKEQWNNFGSGMYGSIGPRCLYARPDTDLTTGFFLAVIERDPKYFADAKKQALDKESQCINSEVEGNSKTHVHDENQDVGEMDQIGDSVKDEDIKESSQKVKKNRKKSKKDKIILIDRGTEEVTCETSKKIMECESNSFSTDESKKKKKSKQRKREIIDVIEEEISNFNCKKTKRKLEKTDFYESLASEIESIGKQDKESKKHKKKKIKNTITEPDPVTEMDGELIIEDIKVDKAQKKKKKNKNRRQGDDSIV